MPARESAYNRVVEKKNVFSAKVRPISSGIERRPMKIRF
jgi:hypothetical protein